MWKLTNSVQHEPSPLINNQSVSCKILYMHVEFERISLADLQLYFLKTQKYYRRLPTGGSWQSIMKRAAAKGIVSTRTRSPFSEGPRESAKRARGPRPGFEMT